MIQIDQEILKIIKESGCTAQEFLESCDRVQKYWHLINMQQKTSSMKRKGSEEARKLI